VSENIINRSDQAAKREREKSPHIIQTGQAVRFPTKSKAIRWVWTSEDAGDDNTVAGNLVSDKGVMESPEIVVHANIIGGSALNQAIPCIAIHNYYPVMQLHDVSDGKDYWWFVQRFQTIGSGLLIDDNNILNSVNVRWVWTAAAAGSGNTILCNLINAAGEMETPQITVHAAIVGGNALDEAIPRVKANANYAVMKYYDGSWWFVQRFQALGPGLFVQNDKLQLAINDEQLEFAEEDGALQIKLNSCP